MIRRRNCKALKKKQDPVSDPVKNYPDLQLCLQVLGRYWYLPTVRTVPLPNTVPTGTEQGLRQDGWKHHKFKLYLQVFLAFEVVEVGTVPSCFSR